MKKKRKTKEWVNDSKVHKWEFAVIVAIGMLLAAFYLYTDMIHTSAGGFRLLNCIKEKQFSMFYYSAYIGMRGGEEQIIQGGSYDFILYMVFAIYNIPLWIWEKITGFSFMQFIVTREYIEGIVWVFAAISSYLLYKIGTSCGLDKEESKWGAILYLTSGIFFFAEVVIGGYDIVSVAFTLLGIYCYLEKKNKGFVLAFAIAIAMKMFALWLFIPLVLLKEKRIWRILIYGLEGISGIAIPKLYFTIASHRHLVNQAIEQAQAAGQQVEQAAIEQTTGYATNELIASAEGIINDALFPKDRFAEYTFLSLNYLPLVFVGMFAVWIFCFLYKKEMEKRNIIYLCAVVMSIFTLTVKLHPQWAIIVVPYLILLIMFYPERMRDNLLLEGVFAVGFVLNKAIIYRWTCNLNMIDNMFWPQHEFSFGSPEDVAMDYGLSYYLGRISDATSISLDNISYLFKAAAVVGLVMLLIYNRPGRKNGEEGQVSYGERRKYVYTRFVISCLIGMLPMVGLIQYLM